MKIVIDTNLWISFLIGKILKGLKDSIFDKRITILTSDEHLEELFSVLKRPKFKKYFTHEDIEKLSYLLDKTGVVVEIQDKVEVCRDRKDNFLIDIAINGGADFIITGDDDLLVLNPFRGISIVKVKEFEARLRLSL
ncbi:hypothetical protein ES705_22220 [subsurface metagenome]